MRPSSLAAALGAPRAAVVVNVGVQVAPTLMLCPVSLAGVVFAALVFVLARRASPA